MILMKLTEFFKSVWSEKAHAISVAASLVAIVGASYGAFQIVDAAIESRVRKQTEVHTELLSALFVQRANSPYNAAKRYSEIYIKSKKEYYPRDLREALVTALIDSISESGFPEEFQDIVEQIEKDNIVSLQRYSLNALAHIYIQIGDADRAIAILRKAIDRVELNNFRPKQVLAESHWLLALSYLSNDRVSPAVEEFLLANQLKPESYRVSDLFLADESAVERYITDFSIFERMKIRNKRLPLALLEFSTQLQQRIAVQ